MCERQADRRSRLFIIGLPLVFFAVILMAGLKVEAAEYWTVTGTKNYLALRTTAEYNDNNVIGKLYNGDQVVITGGWQGEYVWVYAPSLDQDGFVNGKYLSASGGSSEGSSDYRTVTGTKNYLALRSTAEYTDKNVIGKLYNGDQVVITGDWQGEYVWVYAPSLNQDGFVNGKYLSGTGSSSGSSGGSSSRYRTVTGTENYLALRTTAEYNDKNIIGKLYNGDQVIITGDWQGEYVWVYAPSLDQDGFVNGKYLSGTGSSGSSSKKSSKKKSSTKKTVSGTQNYLALRSAPEYSDSNIIGKLYNGDQVEVTGKKSGEYVWVYSSKLDKSGYVNGKYLK